MNARILLLPVVALAALALASAPEAQAAPLAHGISARTGVAFGPVVHVGGRVGFPIGQRSHGHYEETVSYTGGYYETRTREVEVPGRQIGWDFQGQPIYAGSRVELQTYQVWVPQRRIVQRVWVPHRPRGFVTIGGRIRLH